MNRHSECYEGELQADGCETEEGNLIWGARLDFPDKVINLSKGLCVLAQAASWAGMLFSMILSGPCPLFNIQIQRNFQKSALDFFN